MVIKRNVLIIGNAVLFAAPGCDVATQDNGADRTDTRVESDSTPTDMMQTMPDGAPADARATADSAVSVDAQMRQDAFDLGGDIDAMSLVDASAPVDAAVASDASVDSGRDVPDAGALSDLGPLMDMAVADAEVVEVDAAPANVCTELEGQPCRGGQIGCCVDNLALLTCNRQEDGSFAFGPNTWVDLCFCQEPNGGPQPIACAVPGFVGIDAAGQFARRAHSLRRLLLS